MARGGMASQEHRDDHQGDCPSARSRVLILVINPGATSTKIAVFDGDREIYRRSVEHASDELAHFARVVDQFEYRREIVLSVLKEAGYEATDFAAVSGRGGLLRHIPSGTYRISDRVIYDVYNPPYGEHASNLGCLLAKSIADTAGTNAYFTDPVSTDELTEIARVSGFKGMERESFCHALNQKSIAQRAAREMGRSYTDLNLIVLHMGGGVSVVAHKKGRMVDVFNVSDEGSFSMDRAGSLPVKALIDYCFSGRTKSEVKRSLGLEAGVFSYLGTRDFKEVEARKLAGDQEAALIFDALVYQHCKDIGAMAAVLRFDTDAIVLTGGMANSRLLCEEIKAYVGKLAPVMVIPGEEEMRSLAEGTLGVLCGEEAKEY